MSLTELPPSVQELPRADKLWLMQLLAAQLAKDGQEWGERMSGREGGHKGDLRPSDERDRGRIIHSVSFRRLQGKTQVLGITESDFHRTRLTHTMEVAQIGRAIVLQLSRSEEVSDSARAALPTLPLIEAICFAHDLGHPPFGHSGEVALNFMMRNAGGFEGNGQTLRILSKLEDRTFQFGLDLTRRALLGILKYPVKYEQVCRKELSTLPKRLSLLNRSDWEPPKCYFDTESSIVEWILKPLSESDKAQFVDFDEPTDDEPSEEKPYKRKEEKHGKSKYKALDTSIMDIADDIAYRVHDVEDGITLNLITKQDWDEAQSEDPGLSTDWMNKYIDDKQNLIPEYLFLPTNEKCSRKLAVNQIVNALINSVRIDKREQFETPLLAYEAKLEGEPYNFLQALEKLKKRRMIDTQTVQTLEYRGRQIVMSIFEALESDSDRLLDDRYKNRIKKEGKLRVICDYVAGMTDAYATRMYERLFVPRQGSVFERL
ncbi:MAG TPA: anti-phage deoxyguanosine triphosphatase [Chthonomonadaceae bacterium]|nr:anti-phage deoxyguanosine triphosphatase [Chthonomonadaceae bacterium]